MSNRCWLWHDWGKWALFEGVMRYPQLPGVSIPIQRQIRTCHRCGFKQIKKVD